MKLNLRYYVPGAMMIALSLLIVAVPEILVILVASAFSMFGMAALNAGHLIRKGKIDIIRMDNWNTETDFSDIHFAGIPVYERWHSDFYCRM